MTSEPSLLAAFITFARRMLDQQHVSERLLEARLKVFDMLIEQEHRPDKAFDAACQVIHVR